MTAKKPPMPPHLGPRARRFWHEVTDTWALDAAGSEVLRQAVEALDMAERARDTLRTEGLTVNDRYGVPKAHPAVAVEDTARKTFLAAMRSLHLEEAISDADLIDAGVRPLRSA